ncbi:bifunctional delta(1)-pyrroline-2-carboxylate/delta(1)-piperideine-2-car boxylate reductase [Stakelama sediminis]|uniref:LDH2 family malate/lactate/ureidoglycolate dehydrogenase n=1 Tax=Stakelama sediminis TaxID=463200 RepID=A0A840YXS5_9SPHN|nr:Ldh family oxidoreductase [Stakelama sediminis]MBB5718463.1 LDH2 family malate/lactate/ureidoglycolate dehydrogenase [Stakelama sediminis]
MINDPSPFLSFGQLEDLSRSILRHRGLSPDHVEAVTRTIVAGERDGCASHGAYRLIVCAATLATGKVVADAEPMATSLTPALTRVDARGGYAQLAFERGLPLLIEKTRACGIGAMAISNCVHFAALWPEIEAIVAQGLVALACTPSHAWVAPAGGTRPLFGTNPIAFGWPRPGPWPFVFDFATSAVARGEIELHRRAGKPIPEGWGVDTNGEPTTDPAAAMAGAMLTFGGHKGSALSAMIELIAGPLIGDMTSAESLAADDGAGSSPIGGELIIAIDPAGFLGDATATHLQRAEALFSGITGQGARLPSQRRFEARERSLERGGVTLPKALYADLLALLD